jgi:hypothetical protein
LVCSNGAVNARQNISSATGDPYSGLFSNCALSVVTRLGPLLCMQLPRYPLVRNSQTGVIGEIAHGHLRNRRELLQLLQSLPAATEASSTEMLLMIEPPADRAWDRLGRGPTAGISGTGRLCPLDAGPPAGRGRPGAGGGGLLSSSSPSAAPIPLSRSTPCSSNPLQLATLCPSTSCWPQAATGDARSHHHNQLPAGELPLELFDLAGRWAHWIWFFRAQSSTA